MKTISVQSHNRPSMLKHSLDQLSECYEIEDWKVVPFVDGFDKEVRQVYKDHALINRKPICHPNVGLREGNRASIRKMFEEFDSDFNLHVEDDVLIGPDSLVFAEKCWEHFNDHTRVVTLYTDPEAIHLTRDNVHRHKCFHCWGWGMDKKFYEGLFKSARDFDGIEGWAGDIWNEMLLDNQYEYFSTKKRVRNIGWEGFHGESKKLKQEDNRWTGDKLTPGFNTSFICENEQCSFCRQYNEDWLRGNVRWSDFEDE